jgi:hypothetical protein
VVTQRPVRRSALPRRRQLHPDVESLKKRCQGTLLPDTLGTNHPQCLRTLYTFHRRLRDSHLPSTDEIADPDGFPFTLHCFASVGFWWPPKGIVEGSLENAARVEVENGSERAARIGA